VTVHGGKKLGVIKSTATGIEVDIDGLGRDQGPVESAGTSYDHLPPWLRDQLLPEPSEMTQSDLNKLREQTIPQNTLNRMDVFSSSPQGALVRCQSFSLQHVPTLYGGGRLSKAPPECKHTPGMTA